MGDPSYSFSLTLVNLFIGLCRGAAGLPDGLRRLGYQDRGIEVPFRNALDEEVCPDLILASEQIGHTVLCEWKSGGNVEEDQLRRYSRVTSDDLRQRAFVPARAVEAHDTAIFGAQENTQRLSMGLQRADCRFPLLSVTAAQIALRQNQFAKKEPNALFSPGLAVDMDSVPMAFVPFDRESADWVIAQYSCTQIVDYMQNGESLVLLDRLVSDLYPTWPMIGARAQAELRDRVYRIVLEAARRELRVYLRRNRQSEGRTHTPTWDIQSSPLQLSTDKRTAAWKRLRKQAQTFVNALRTGSRQFNLVNLETEEGS